MELHVLSFPVSVKKAVCPLSSEAYHGLTHRSTTRRKRARRNTISFVHLHHVNARWQRGYSDDRGERFEVATAVLLIPDVSKIAIQRAWVLGAEFIYSPYILIRAKPKRCNMS